MQMKSKNILLIALTVLMIIFALSSVSLAKNVVLKLGHIFTPTSCIHNCTQMVADLVDKRSKGNLKNRYFPGRPTGSSVG